MDDHRTSLVDPFLRNYQPSELRIAAEFLTTWLPFLSRDLCNHCASILSRRIRSLDPELPSGAVTECQDVNVNVSSTNNMESCEINDNRDDNCDTYSLGSWNDGANGCSEPVPEVPTSEVICESPSTETPSTGMLWADMAQEDEVEEEEEHQSNKQVVTRNVSFGKLRISKILDTPKLSSTQREFIRFKDVRRKKDFICLERVNGKLVNILEGLELHKGVFSTEEQEMIVRDVMTLQEMGKRGELRGRTYTAPQKWMRGKGRVTIQFGCCYNYAMDKNGNPPGILQSGNVDPIPHFFKVIIQRLVRWHVLPPTCVPDSCIVNIYDEGDCIPPHIDNHDFVRPFCTVSFLSECNIVFGTDLNVVGAGEFAGSIAIPLPVGSVLVLNGNGADVAKHCVPAVPTKRISITFRRMDESKRPIGYIPEPDLQGLRPLSYEVEKTKNSNVPQPDHHMKRRTVVRTGRLEVRGSPDSNGIHIDRRLRDSIQTRHMPANRRWSRVNLGSQYA
ncbi:oxidoreductase, 2OG-Fe(II) oxygenase family protein [Quillaja saponaria]|uniref:Oxidoreductase, 2OG-Fe(II) oxygenase family protein n=1 Tax=Quillaja saponaria TaxID=32244 RepID=A0AAD7PFL7_QUISA|nr:oxidoreductase, 2OG-Fe(II) oxygenase family protein [Quillaja saponaria]